MERPSFSQKIALQESLGHHFCLGLDPDLRRFPRPVQEKFNGNQNRTFDMLTSYMIEMVDMAIPLGVVAFKPQSAFYEQYGEAGREALLNIVEHIHSRSEHTVPVICDAKRGDVERTAEAYGNAMFAGDRKGYDFDAITVHSYLGPTTYPSFIKEFPDRGLIGMCKTSNPGSGEIQDIIVDLECSLRKGALSVAELHEVLDLVGTPRLPLYYFMAYKHRKVSQNNPNIGIVVGATYPEAFEPVRKLYGDGNILIPGTGEQGGDLAKTLRHAPNSKGGGIIINVASAVLYASQEDDYLEAAAAKINKYNEMIKEGLAQRVA